MGGVAGYTAVLKKSGTSTSFTGEAMSVVTGDIFKIDTASKAVWDRTIPPVIYDGVGVISASTYTVDYLFGTVSLGSTPAGAVTADGNYMPMTDVAGASEFNLERLRAALEDTTFVAAAANGGCETYTIGMKTATATINRFDDILYDFTDRLDAGTPFVLEFRLDSSNVRRGWFLITTTAEAVPIDALITEASNFVLDGDATLSFSTGSA